MFSRTNLAVAILAVGFSAISAAVANAGMITSPADPALSGAQIETFNSAPLGSYVAPLMLSDVTVSGNTNFLISDGADGQYVPPDSPGDRFVFFSGTSLIFDFHLPVSAFGLVIGAANSPGTLTAFDAGNNLVGSIDIPDQVATIPYPHSGFYGVSSGTPNIDYFVVRLAGSDSVVFDDLHYTAVPEPSSLALLGMSAFGLLAVRRKRWAI